MFIQVVKERIIPVRVGIERVKGLTTGLVLVLIQGSDTHKDISGSIAHVIRYPHRNVTADGYAQRLRAEEEKHKQLPELEETPAPPIAFDEKLWHAVVERVTVYNDDRPVYSLQDGSEITVML